VNHDTALVATVAIGLGYALVFGFVCARLHLPPLLGYLLAGVAVGPFTPGFVADAELAPQLAEIGVILLMFGVGMHFSLRDLARVWRIAVPGAILQIAVATGLGIAIATAWGWSLGGGLVLGMSLSVASTVVLLRALEAGGIMGSPDGRLAIGWLIVEDLLTVLALVVLPAVAGSLGGEAAPIADGGSLALTLAVTIGRVGLFVALMLVIGARLFPWLLEQVAQTGSRELFTLAVVSAALGVGFVSAELFGVSFALGAFFAGVVIRESDHSKRAEADTRPLQDSFAVLFFVSVGMLFDPLVLVNDPIHVLAVLAVIVLGKSAVAFALVRFAGGRSLAGALTVSVGLAQVGEFSFILASLGMELGLLPMEGRNLILAGALLSITANAFLFRAALRLSAKAPTS
jgi:CPA2 family monovalent cation:H+ antiporter-2